MFKQRLLTTIVLVPLVLLGLYYATPAVAIGTALLLLIACALEWQQLIPVTHPTTRIIFFIALTLAMLAIPPLFNGWLGSGLIVWVGISAALISYPGSQCIWGYRLVVALLAILLLPLFAQSFILVFLHPAGKALILTLLLLVWGADIGGYLIGKVCGKHKLIPKVSPGKTIEGVLGGASFSLFVAAASYPYFESTQQIAAHQHLKWLLIGLFVFVMALIGDLLMSMLKRRVQIKDTGTIFPGHGGILDRLDSLIAATPAFYFGLFWITPGT